MTIKSPKNIIAAFLSLVVAGSMLSAVSLDVCAATKTGSGIGVTYRVYERSGGWNQSAKANGSQAGVIGLYQRVNALKLKLTGSVPSGATVQYQVHSLNKGWNAAKSGYATAGTAGNSQGFDAIRITLNNLPGYEAVYRVYQHSYGWSAWKKTRNGTSVASAAVAGTIGKSKVAEAIQIKLAKIPAIYNIKIGNHKVAISSKNALSMHSLPSIIELTQVTATLSENVKCTIYFYKGLTVSYDFKVGKVKDTLLSIKKDLSAQNGWVKDTNIHKSNLVVLKITKFVLTDKANNKTTYKVVN